MNDNCHHEFEESEGRVVGDIYIKDGGYLWYNSCSKCGRRAYRMYDTDEYYVHYNLYELIMNRSTLDESQ